MICLYSKYSEQCVAFFEDMSYLKGVRMLCIDNKDVRKIIENDPCTFDIDEVPCILVFHVSGRLDKYEGRDAFSWLDERKTRMIQSTQKIAQVLASQHAPTPPTSSQFLNQEPDEPVSRHMVNQWGDAAEAGVLSGVSKSNPRLRNKNPVQMSDVLSDPSEESSVSSPPAEHTPGDPVPIDVSEEQRSGREAGQQVLKKKGNIMAMAMNMAKQRESEIEANDPMKRAQLQQQQQQQQQPTS